MAARNPSPLVECLSALEDPRQPSNGTLHDFQEMLMILVAATLSDHDTVEEIVVWAHAHEAWLRRYLRLTHGIPSQDTFLRLLQLLNPAKLEASVSAAGSAVWSRGWSGAWQLMERRYGARRSGARRCM